MFQAARFKLTLWYCIIITVICVFLTLPFYFSSNQELDQLSTVRANPSTSILPPRIPLSGGSISQARTRIVLMMFIVNGIVIMLGSTFGYFFAGKTLKPIKNMLEEQDRFITDASHELRTPLTSLRSELEYVLMKYTLTDNVKKHLESNLEEVEHMQNLTNSLLILSKKQNIPTKTLTEISLLDVLEDAIKKIIPLAKEKNITIDNQIKDFKLQADHQTLSQIFVILLDNAIKYSENGKKIHIDTKITDHHIVINVKDEGKGIDESSLKHIFERFYRSDKARSKIDVTGYGLGLPIAKKLIEDYKGSIQVASKVGKGSTFSVTLPLSYN